MGIHRTYRKDFSRGSGKRHEARLHFSFFIWRLVFRARLQRDTARLTPALGSTTCGKSLEYFDEETKQRFIPHVVEPSAGVDRTVLALICEAYSEDQAPDEKGKMETRIVLRFHPRMAPIKCAVFPLLKNKEPLVAKAKEIVGLLRPYMNVFYDESGAIGRRYRRQDEIGTPFGVTVDFETLGEKDAALRDTVTLRDRDSMKQERVAIQDLPGILRDRLA